jgi:predicted AlkP superfamily phosphohydrolase/phosphomutase
MHVLILGLDAFDPSRFERLSEEGRLPNLTKYVESLGYSRFEIAIPPQTEVSWTSIATGLNPGGHGVFDFVHRNPATYTPYVSLLPTRRGFLGTQFAPPFEAHTIFEEAAREGYPATALWWPATFPYQSRSLVRTVPGLGAPDIRGRLGVGTAFSVDVGSGDGARKTSVERLERIGRDRYTGLLKGPALRKRQGVQAATAELRLDVVDEKVVRLSVGNHSVELTEGVWSPILEVSFKVGRFLSVRSLTRAILTQVRPAVAAYVLPLQIHPLHSPWRYAAPRSFVKRIWRDCGPFLTLGWPQDTTALEEGFITDRQFLDLCGSILEARECVFMHQLQEFREGILASVFDSLDRVQHMFWRDRPDIVDEWYVKLDALIGRIERRLAGSWGGRAKLFILSDHGFSDFGHKVHLNRWLIERGYLVPKEESGSGSLQAVDWAQSQAYAVGLNSAYLNLAGREGQGCVQTDQYDLLIEELRDGLLDWPGPDGRPVVRQAWRRDEVFAGPFTEHGPDIVVGYSPGYRASADTGLGKWEASSVEPNRDHWGADNCIDSRVVPGVLFSNQDLANYPHPSYRDVPAMVVGKALDQDGIAPPPSFSAEDEEIIEERLESLGYL